ncbi:MAG: UvrD-helicase domain-containing protein [Fibrobacterales bacterium]|nr:UvrD-helicase domain-containing protein [Fibrobacterales bacterium]
MSEQFDIREFDPSRSLSVEASAGTGKTYTIQLMVARMIASGTPLEKILLVTYTEKAAGELKDRLRRKIDDVLGSGRVADGIEIGAIVPPGVDWKANFEAARQSVDNAQVFTIHSFCQKVLREHAYEAGLPFETGNVAEEAVGELIDELIRDRWSEDGEFVALLDDSDGASSLAKSLKSAFAGIIDKYRGKDRNGEEIVSLGDVESPKLGDDRLSVEDLEKIAKATEFGDLNFLPEFGDMLGAFESVEKTDAKSRNFLDCLRKWKAGDELFNGHSFQARHFHNDAAKKAFEYFKNVKELMKSAGSAAKSARFQRFLVSRAGDVFDAWQRRKAEEKLQTFNDMILSVHRAFMEDGNSLKERIRDRYQYAVIDEFQDTNQLQWDIFKTLFFDVKDHAVFVVGDPKQSIYGFQGADIRVYQRAVGEIKNARRLSCNYRSTEEMVNALKALFGNGYFVADEAESDEIHASGKVVPPEIGGEPAKPVWTMESEGGPEDFAKAAVAKIVEWCSGGKTRLRIYDKDAEKLRDATFGDFAVLARTGTEMPEIEDALRKAGVPYARYKEKRLFASRECAEWIALFRAVASPDFAAENHKALNEALVTDFFGRRLVDVETDLFDDPMCAERRKVEAWHALARRGRWAEMLERILADTEVEGRLSDIGKMQGLSRLRQIGSYSVDYLYGNRCSLDALIRHLEGLARGDDEADDENGDLVEKGTDFDAVQVMTIHASKGLQFPVVIAFGGFIGHNNSAEGPYLYHDGNRALLGFGKGAKENQKKEGEEEWRRLFYVCYTRAESLLLLPKYDKGRKTSPYGIFLAKAIEAVENDCGKLQKFEGDASELKKAVQAVLASPKTDCTNDDSGATETRETDNRGRLQRELGGKRVYQHSYSTLSKRVGTKPDEAGRLETPSVEPEGGERPDRDDAAGVLGASSKTIDPENVSKAGEDATTDDERRRFDRARYPKGARVGNALHKLFETTAFREFGQTYPDPDKAVKSAESGNLGVRIDEQFELESLDVRSHGAEWNPLTAGILWNTLHARLPVIAGGSFRDDAFCLAELPPEAHRPEVRFDLLAARTENAELQGVCKGFIDLLFVREVDGVKRYSILDWKSDGLEDYAPATVRKRVDDHYCVQRVLYSYCLIQWLKQFYGNDEAEVFENRFGGVYYVFLRGTRGGTDSGVYAQTWKDYASLEKAFENVKGLM